ncbi:MAG: hypothetical protein WBA74_23265, partial [Cyclobacteriaceae bacterium]
MKTASIYTLSLFLALLTTQIVAAQSMSQNDKVVLSAMKDELANNMENLQEEGFDKPFFMGYTVTDMKLRQASAVFGAKITSKESENRDWNTRIMVGGYDVNDENFNDAFAGSSNDVFYESVPIDADYLGLR